MICAQRPLPLAKGWALTSLWWNRAAASSGSYVPWSRQYRASARQVCNSVEICQTGTPIFFSVSR